MSNVPRAYQRRGEAVRRDGAAELGVASSVCPNNHGVFMGFRTAFSPRGYDSLITGPFE
jgi:hypothetical protein